MQTSKINKKENMKFNIWTYFTSKKVSISMVKKIKMTEKIIMNLKQFFLFLRIFTINLPFKSKISDIITNTKINKT